MGSVGCYAWPVVLGGAEFSNPTAARWIDTGIHERTGFVPATRVRYFGNSGRHDVRTDGVSDFDVSLFEQLKFSESRCVEFHFEPLDVFNTPTFGTHSRVFNSSNFGTVTGTALRERNIQTDGKIGFCRISTCGEERVILAPPRHEALAIAGTGVPNGR